MHYDKSDRHAVIVAQAKWFDQTRRRTIPVVIRHPAKPVWPTPVIVVSHRLGGSRRNYAYLGRHWASHGYLVVHVQHPGSDRSLWSDAAPTAELLRRIAVDPIIRVDRLRDIRFVIDRLQALAGDAAQPSFARHVDASRVGVAGHSFGAQTVLDLAGQRIPLRDGSYLLLRDHRVGAVLAMSPSAPRTGAKPAEAFAAVDVPCLHMTGTKDRSPVGLTPPDARRIPFDHIDGADQYLVVFHDGDHDTFRGPAPGEAGRAQAIHAHILAATLAFWDAYLHGEASARAWLSDGGLAAALKDTARLEVRVVKGV